MKANKTLNFLFVFAIIGEAIFLIIFPLTSIIIYVNIDWVIRDLFPLWSTLPFILLTGLTTTYYKTIIRAIIFLIVNLSPIIISVWEINSTYGDKSYTVGIIVIGIFQVIYLILCIILFKIKSWKWISDPINRLDNNHLNDKLKKVHNIHQFEKALFLMTISFLGIWIFQSEIYDIFFDKLDFLYLLSIIIIIPISIALVAIEKESVSLLILFYIASCSEIAIIIFRLFKFYLKVKNQDIRYISPIHIHRSIFGN